MLTSTLYTGIGMTISVPEAFRERYVGLVDDEQAFFDSLITPLPKSFRVNTLKAVANEVMARFAGYGVVLQRMPWYPDAFVSENPALGTTLEHFLGSIYIQELTSMLPPLLVLNELTEDKTVLDACAAPGSKTTQLAAMMGNKGAIVANDVEYERIRPLKFNLEKSGALNAVVTNYDLRSFPQMEFDIILLDAPCSSEGIFRKNPKQMAMWSPRRIPPSTHRQKQLILKAFDLLADGGTMIYSTCTFAPEENEAVIDYLLKERKAELAATDVPHFRLTPGLTEWQGHKFDDRLRLTSRILPHHNDTGGFFLAKVKK